VRGHFKKTNRSDDTTIMHTCEAEVYSIFLYENVSYSDSNILLEFDGLPRFCGQHQSAISSSVFISLSLSGV
jgi:hypothetical protein